MHCSKQFTVRLCPRQASPSAFKPPIVDLYVIQKLKKACLPEATFGSFGVFVWEDTASAVPAQSSGPAKPSANAYRPVYC